MRTTAIMNLKGGTAKTITAINTAAILSKIHGHKVLLVDADSQGNLSEFTAANPNGLPMAKGTSSLLRGDAAGPIPTKMRDVLLIHGDDDLMALDVSAARSGIANPMAIRDLLDKYAKDDLFDNVLIDCPPAFSASAMAALAAADEVVIPVKLDAFGISGLSRIVSQVRNMRKVNPDLEIAGVLPTMFVVGSDAHRKALYQLQEVLEALGIRCFHQIRYSRPVDSSTFQQEALVYSSPKCGACRDYKIFVRDLIGEEDERYAV